MKIGLVLEGGANRGVFTSGVLDYFMEQDLGKAFRYVIGTSAGMTFAPTAGTANSMDAPVIPLSQRISDMPILA